MPAAASSPVELLKHAPHVCVRGICCEGEHSVRGGVRQRYRSRQGGLSCFERGDSGGRLLQCLGGPSECICEWLECAADTWKETSVKIHHT